MLIMRTMEDPLRTEADNGLPPHINTQTHWWDALQIYGCNAEHQRRMRLGKGGKLLVPEDEVLAPDNESLVQQTESGRRTLVLVQLPALIFIPKLLSFL